MVCLESRYLQRKNPFENHSLYRFWPHFFLLDKQRKSAGGGEYDQWFYLGMRRNAAG